MATFQSLIESTYLVLGVQSGASNYPLETVKSTINKLVSRVVNGKVASLIEFDRAGNPKMYTAGDLPFREKRKLYTPIQTGNLTADIDSSSTEVPFDATNFDSTGAIYVGGEIITYTSKTTTEVLGISTPQITHYSGTVVYPLYPLPTDISKPYTFFWIDQGGNKINIPPQDNRQDDQHYNYFSIMTDNNGNDYLLMRGQPNQYISDQTLLLIYYAKAEDMVNNEDICIIPDTYTDFIPPLVAGQLSRDQDETETAKGQILKGERGLNEMYQYYNEQTKVNKNKVRLKPANFNAIIWYWYYGQNRGGYYR
jgi:hypothetical protein